MVLVILAIAASIVIPFTGDNNAGRLRASAELLAADIEDIQARALAEPTDPVRLRVDDDGAGWWLEHVNDPGTPLEGIDGRPVIRRMGAEALAGIDNVVIRVRDLPEEGLQFDDQGAPVELANSILFELETRESEDRLQVEVSASTGRTSITRP